MINPPVVRVVWDRPKMVFISEALPQEAHNAALQAAAFAAAGAINSQETGALENDVQVPKPLGRLSGAVGSDLPYAAIQDQGGDIRPRSPDGWLYIKGQKTPTGEATPPGTPVRREAFPRTGRFAGTEITARVKQVTIAAKHYLAFAPPAYAATLVAVLRARFPR